SLLFPCARPPALPVSFPTRRSSDLDSLVLECKRFPMMAERQVVVVREAQHLKTIEGLAGYADNPTPTTVLVLAYKFKSADKRKRSEEHTSELQSRENLVCRLLLEKK